MLPFTVSVLRDMDYGTAFYGINWCYWFQVQRGQALERDR